MRAMVLRAAHEVTVGERPRSSDVLVLDLVEEALLAGYRDEHSVKVMVHPGA